MLLFLLLCAFLQTLWGKPLPSPLAPSSGITANVTSVMAPQECPAAPDDGQKLRSIYDIVQSCLFTIFACVWTSIHPNINGPRDSWWTCTKRRVVTTLCAVIAPELVLLWALRQRFAAKDIADEYNREFAALGATEESTWAKMSQLFKPHAESTRRGARQPWSIIHGLFTLIGGFVLGKLTQLFQPLPETTARRDARQPWTVTHGFFVQMGGFLSYEHGNPKEVLTYERLEKLLDTKAIDALVVTEADLQDKSKGNTISKGIVVLQTSWFVLQCIVRAIQHLPLSELEILTLAFAVLNGAIYAAWWDKPQGVDTAIFIPLKQVGNIGRGHKYAFPPASSRPGGSQHAEEQHLMQSNGRERWLKRMLQEDRDHSSSPVFLLLHLPYRIIGSTLRPFSKILFSLDAKPIGPRISMFYSRYDRNTLGAPEHVAFVIGIIFGAIHLLGWAIEFPLPRERILWQTSAVVLTVAPFVFLVTELSLMQDSPNWIISCTGYLTYPSIPFYIVARFVVIVIAFKAILHPPPRVLLDISWTRYIPHL